jgi:hypothetical protein
LRAIRMFGTRYMLKIIGAGRETVKLAKGESLLYRAR